MTEEQFIKTINTLLAFAAIFMMYGVIYYVASDHTKPEEPVEEVEEISIVDIIEENSYTQKEVKPDNFRNKALIEEAELRNLWLSVPIHYTTLELRYLGQYFITSYCPEECGGSWTTSSGATCHYSDDWSTPTTCAIDRKFHRYGELIQVGDPDDPNKKIYITEDTGPGVQGRWVDCFVETMSEVRSWNTGYRPVYSVSYEEHVLEGRRIIYHEYFNRYLLFSSFRSGDLLWDAPGIMCG